MPSTSSRTYVVTGYLSGIGLATSEALRDAGHRVIGVDRTHDADVCVDLSIPGDWRALVFAVGELLGGVPLHGVIAGAGVGGGQNKPQLVLDVNYRGATATLRGLRGFMEDAEAPQALAVGSIALLGGDEEIVEALLHDRHGQALALCNDAGPAAYAASKRALARWVKLRSTEPEWAGAGIGLNMVAPGMVLSPMSTYYLGTAEQRAAALAESPQPFRGIGDVHDIAALIAWLVSEQNRFMTGQVVFADGGYEAYTSRGYLPVSHGGRF